MTVAARRDPHAGLADLGAAVVRRWVGPGGLRHELLGSTALATVVAWSPPPPRAVPEPEAHVSRPDPAPGPRTPGCRTPRPS
jgi:hypothetical protein